MDTHTHTHRLAALAADCLKAAALEPEHNTVIITSHNKKPMHVEKQKETILTVLYLVHTTGFLTNFKNEVCQI